MKELRRFISFGSLLFFFCFYLLTTSSWAQYDERKLAAGNDSVSISGNYAIMGDFVSRSRGSAYIFERSGSNWIQRAKLTASDGAADDGFGLSVSMSGDYVIVGAPLDDDNGIFSGSAYIFERIGSDWIQRAKLTANDGGADDGFGESVSISGNYAIVGQRSGSAYIFERTGSDWIQRAKLTANDGGAGGGVSISGNYAIVGAPHDDDNGIFSGSAYIFERSGSNWIQRAKLTASDGAEYDCFGWSVSISGEYVIVGGVSGAGVVSLATIPYSVGPAYIFKKPVGGWTDMTQTAKLTAIDGALTGSFGWSVSMSGDYVIVGAGDSAYVYLVGEENTGKLKMDFNGDGNQDVLLLNNQTGQVNVWLTKPGGIGLLSYGSPGTVSDKNWEIIGVGNFNSATDAKTDILWRNKVTGQVNVWLMNGTALLSKGTLGTVSDLAWEIIKTGDFNADSNADLLWRHNQTGMVFVWLTKPGSIGVSSIGSPGTVSDMNWAIQ